MKNVILNPNQRIIVFLLLFVIVILVSLWCFKVLNSLEMTATLGVKSYMYTLTNKKAVMVVSFRDFRDEEYFVPKEMLEAAGVQLKTASNKKGLPDGSQGKAIGADGGEVLVDFLVSEVKPSDFDAIIFIGGPGTLSNLDNEDSYKLAKDAVSQNKILSAICASPAVLAKAGVLNGKKTTVWSSALDKSLVKILKENGAIYQDESLVVDGKIITASGPAAAREFGGAIIKALQ